MTKPMNARLIRGWIAVGLSTLLSAFWAYWGAIENFHEGWYTGSLVSNLVLGIMQYLSPALLVAGAGVAAVRWPRTGGALHVGAGIGAAWFFRASGAGAVLIALPLMGLGLLYITSAFAQRRRALIALIGVPTLVGLAFGAGPAWRVHTRIDDGVRHARVIEGAGVRLLWAGAGPGWPVTGGLTWKGAADRCAHLDSTGTKVHATRSDTWRLPSVAEAVASMARHGANAGGLWDPDAHRATYSVKPDKESPLWDTRSPVIYWWTGTAAAPGTAYMIAYDGNVYPRSTGTKPVYFGYRCVRSP